MNSPYAWRTPELDETFTKVAATRHQSLILRAIAAELRAESNRLKVTAAKLTSQSTQLRATRSSAPILRGES